jgi:hypothetical protein
MAGAGASVTSSYDAGSRHQEQAETLEESPNEVVTRRGRSSSSQGGPCLPFRSGEIVSTGWWRRGCHTSRPAIASLLRRLCDEDQPGRVVLRAEAPCLQSRCNRQGGRPMRNAADVGG